MLDTLADDLRATWSWLRVFWPTCGLAAAAPMRQGIGLHSPPENAMSQPGTPTAS